jgi:hypothetical protein
MSKHIKNNEVVHRPQTKKWKFSYCNIARQIIKKSHEIEQWSIKAKAGDKNEYMMVIPNKFNMAQII